jgi:hypothetical protein
MVGGETRGGWHDGPVRAAALLIPAMLLVPVADGAADAAASRSQRRGDVAGATQPTPPSDPAAPTSTANPFLPDKENVTECFSSLPPPECGNEERGDLPQILTFAILMLGMAFIGWRIALGVRRRDRVLSPDNTSPVETSPSSDAASSDGV